MTGTEQVTSITNYYLKFASSPESWGGGTPESANYELNR